MGILDNLFDKEAMVKNTIENCLENLAMEMQCKATDLFIMIKPTTAEFSDENNANNFKNWVYRIENGSPKLIREITLKEILGD